MIKESIIRGIQDYRLNQERWSGEISYSDSEVLYALSMVSEFNMRGEALCGSASYMMQEYLPRYFSEQQIDATVFTATAATGNGCFHHFNIVKAPGEEAVICDLTASQFFTKPMDSFSGTPYFIGTRQQLKQIVEQAKANTWAHLQKNFPEKQFRTPWDFDLEIFTNHDFGAEIGKSLKAEKLPCLITESLFYPFEITWGNLSRMLRKPETLSEAFDIEANIEGLVLQRTAEIANLVSYASRDKLTRNDGPVAP